MNITIDLPDIGLTNQSVPMTIQTDVPGEITVKFRHNENDLYEAAYYISDKTKIDIRDILKTTVSALDTEIQPNTITKEITEQKATIQIKFYESANNNYLTEKNITAFWGGASKYFVRNGSQKDIISQKIVDICPILTSRSGGRFIFMRETEIYPAKILLTNKSVTAVTPTGNLYNLETVQLSGSETFKIYHLNIAAIRKYFFDQYSEIPSYLTFIIDGFFAFQIIFTPGSLTKIRHLLQFRNSLGCYERIEVTGKAEISQENESDPAEYSIWDESVMDYITSTDRRKSNMIITAETGYKNRDELMFVWDLLASDDIYLVDGSGTKSKITVTSDNFKVPLSEYVPTSVTLKIKSADSDTNYTSKIDNSEPENATGEWILQRGQINGKGFIYPAGEVKTI